MKLLLVEDEVALSRATMTILKHHGYEVDCAYDGTQALAFLEDASYDCIICDIMMPVMDGLTLLKTIRSRGVLTPVIMLTAKSEVDDRIDGLDAGADDYVTKPYAMAELLARVRAAIRRQNGYTPHVLSYANITLDRDSQELKSKNAVRLASLETKMLAYFIMNAKKTISHEELLRYLWQEDDDPGLVYVYVSYLRRKLQAVDAKVTIMGDDTQGYRFEQVMSDD